MTPVFQPLSYHLCRVSHRLEKSLSRCSNTKNKLAGDMSLESAEAEQSVCNTYQDFRLWPFLSLASCCWVPRPLILSITVIKYSLLITKKLVKHPYLSSFSKFKDMPSLGCHRSLLFSVFLVTYLRDRSNPETLTLVSVKQTRWVYFLQQRSTVPQL